MLFHEIQIWKIYIGRNSGKYLIFLRALNYRQRSEILQLSFGDFWSETSNIPFNENIFQGNHSFHASGLLKHLEAVLRRHNIVWLLGLRVGRKRISNKPILSFLDHSTHVLRRHTSRNRIYLRKKNWILLPNKQDRVKISKTKLQLPFISQSIASR